MSNDRFGPNTTCVVTGGLGFIGSHFIDKVLSMGWKVINIDKVNYASLNLDFNQHPKYQHIKEDIAEIKDIPYCDLIINFAAESHVDNSITGAGIFIKSNFLGVFNLLDIIKNKIATNSNKSWTYKLPLFLQISTDEVFGDILEGSFAEDDRFKPSNPYAASKAAAEQLVVAWGRTYGLPYMITRTTNNYGCRQHPEKLMPMAICKCLRNEKLIIHGSGEYIRNWIHVEDNVEAIMLVLQKGTYGESYHIGSDDEFSVKQICEKILNKFGKNYSITNIDNSFDRSGADVRYALNTSKIKQLGWNQQHRLDDDLGNIIAYFQDNMDRCAKVKRSE